MSTVKDIEEAVLTLSTTELAAFREWFAEFDAEAWDRQIERDAAAGRLDALADEAIADLHAIRCTERSDIAPAQGPEAPVMSSAPAKSITCLS